MFLRDWQKALSWLIGIRNLRGERQSRYARIVRAIGSISAAILIVWLFVGEFIPTSNQAEIMENNPWILYVGGISFGVFFTCFFLLAIDYLSQSRTRIGKEQGVSGVFKKIFLYLYLPAIVITLTLVAIALVVRALK